MRLLPNGSVTELSPGKEFTNVAGFVTFINGLSSQSITLTPVQDGDAELDESFELHLINATGKIICIAPRSRSIDVSVGVNYCSTSL